MSLRSQFFVSPTVWELRAIWFRQRGDLDAAHRCELRAEDLRNIGKLPMLNGYV